MLSSTFDKNPVRAGLLMLAAAIALSACAPTPAPAPPVNQAPPPGSILVNVTNTGCPSVESKAGVAVTWTNSDSQVRVFRGEAGPDGSRLFDSGEVAPGGSFTFVFTEAGDFPYHCLPEENVKLRVIVIP
jgi:hypothetical protein